MLKHYTGYSITEEMLEDDLYNNPPEPKMQLYFYAIVQTKKNGEYKSVEQYDIVAARDEDDAKMQALQRIVEMAEYDEALRTDRLKVVVRPF